MKNSRLFYVLLLALNFWGTSGTVQLDEFLKAVADARPELQWLEGEVADSAKMRKRSASIGELLGRFDSGNDEAEQEMEGGDAWYQSLRAMECKHGGGGCQKKPMRWTPKKAQPEDYYEYYEEEVKSKELKDQREETPNDLSHEANYKLSKAEQDAAAEAKPRLDTAWPLRRHSKQRVDRMNADKLETSQRMLKNHDVVTSEERMPTNNLDSRELGEGNKLRKGRRLLSVEDPGDDSALVHALDLDQFDNLKQKTSMDRKLGGLTFDNTEGGRHQHKNYLKANHNQGTTTAPMNLAEKDHDVNIKMHMSVNATVLGEDKLPQGFHRNKTMSFKPLSEMSNKRAMHEEELDGRSTIGEDRSRDRRRVMFPNRRSKEDISTVIEATDEFPLDEVISGQLTSELVKAVFELVKTSPTLNVLWPGLMRNKVAKPIVVQNFDVIRTQDTELETHRAEIMFRQAMEAVNAIIDQQVRSSSCVQLRSDLEAFYTLVLETQAENERRQARRKRDSHATMSNTEIRKKSKLVQKLLKNYEELPRDDQQQVASVKRSLLVANQQLREMQRQSKRHERQIVALHLNDNYTSGSAFETRDSDHVLSPEYIKLTKTAELLRLQTSFSDPDLPLDFSYV